MPHNTTSIWNKIDQRKVANLLIVLFLGCSLLGIILIIFKYYFVFYEGHNISLVIQENHFIRLFVECFSGILIVIAWLALIKETRKIGGAPDWGLAWLSVAILCWSIGDLINIVFQFHNAFSPQKDHTISPVLHSVTSRVISTLNSFCFLFSLHYLELSEKSRWKKLRDRLEKIFTIKFTAIILLAIIVLTIFLGIQFKHSTSFYVFIPDLILSFVTTAALWFFFTEYFEQRKIAYMGFFISVVSLVIVLVQLGHLVKPEYLQPFFIKENAPILSMIYRPFLITLFLLVAFSSIRNEKEKQAILERRDMNHAIRGSLHILNHNIKKLSKHAQKIESVENAFILQDLVFRVKAIYDLHNLIHNEHHDEKISLKKYLNNLVENIKYAFEYEDMHIQFMNISNLSINRSLLRKIGTVIAELIINAAKVSIVKNEMLKEGNKLSPKLLALKVANNQSQLQIEVSDNGIYAPDLLNKTKTGHGLNLIKRIIEEDFEGSLHLNKNEWEGTSIAIHIPINNVI